jgi:uncharacterized protein (TIGR02996 family)
METEFAPNVNGIVTTPRITWRAFGAAIPIDEAERIHQMCNDPYDVDRRLAYADFIDRRGEYESRDRSVAAWIRYHVNGGSDEPQLWPSGDFRDGYLFITRSMLEITFNSDNDFQHITSWKVKNGFPDAIQLHLGRTFPDRRHDVAISVDQVLALVRTVPFTTWYLEDLYIYEYPPPCCSNRYRVSGPEALRTWIQPTIYKNRTAATVGLARANRYVLNKFREACDLDPLPLPDPDEPGIDP